MLLLCYYYCQQPPQMHFANCCPGGKSREARVKGLGPGLYVLQIALMTLANPTPLGLE